MLKIIYHLFFSMSIPFINYLLFRFENFFSFYKASQKTQKARNLRQIYHKFRTFVFILHWRRDSNTPESPHSCIPVFQKMQHLKSDLRGWQPEKVELEYLVFSGQVIRK